MGDLKLFDLLQGLDAEVTPERSKLHLAGVADDGSNPLDEFFAGEFEGWQPWQTKRNFERPLVVSLIQMPRKDRWLFAGVFDSRGKLECGGASRWFYNLVPRESVAALKGRVIVRHRRAGRASYLDAERWSETLVMDEVRAERMAMADFPGFTRVCLRKCDLDVLMKQGAASWKSALSHVAGVYVITDTSDGRQYVGSATGIGGIWSRWSSYSKTGHGGNKDLRALLKAEGAEHARHFQYGILETGDSNTTQDEILARESHWKRLLGTRAFGLNGN